MLLLEYISLLSQASVQTEEQKVFLQETKTSGAEPEPSASHQLVKARLKCEPAEWEAPEEQGKGERHGRESRAKMGPEGLFALPAILLSKVRRACPEIWCSCVDFQMSWLVTLLFLPIPHLPLTPRPHARRALQLSRAHPQPPFFFRLLLF